MADGAQPPSPYQETVTSDGGYTNYMYVSEPPPQGYYDPDKPGAQPGYQAAGQQPIPSTQQSAVLVQPPTRIIVVGNCPTCRVGVLEDHCTWAGVLCTILLVLLFLPIGFLCCVVMKQRRCPSCGAVFGFGSKYC